MSTLEPEPDYEAFLKGANKDYSKSYEASNRAPHPGTATIAVDTDPHPAIKALGTNRYYVSDSDEPFESIEFNWHKEGLPTAGLFTPY